MLRDAQIPIVLWISAAAMVHVVGGGGAKEATTYVHDRAQILAFARDVRAGFDDGDGNTTEIEVLGIDELPAEPIEPKEEPVDQDAEDDDADVEDDDPEPQPLAPVVKPEAPEPKPEPEEKKEPEPKKVAATPPPTTPPTTPAPPTPKDAAKPKTEAAPPTPVVIPKPDGRIAVINDPTLDKDQKDNPDAKRIADHANHVAEEAMAKHRTYDRNDPNPKGGGKPRFAADDRAGNAAKDERGFSTEAKGEGAPRAGAKQGPQNPPPVAVARRPDVPRQAKVDPVPGQTGIKARQAGSGDASPAAMSSDSGSWSIDPEKEGDGRQMQKARKGRRAIAGRRGIPGVRMPKQGLPFRYNLSQKGLIESIGAKNLRAEQEKARNTRLAKRRGAWKGADFGRFRAAIENYDPSVKPGNQTSLNAAKVPFASFINKMHNRIHPVFADGFLQSLNGLDPTDKLRNLKLVTHMELVIDAQSGKLVRAGITKPSGVTAFEVAALRSVEQAGPYGKAPGAIISPDGNVYLHWEFHRDPYYACTSKFARPYILKKAPKKTAPPDDPPPPPAPEGERYGKRAPLAPKK